MILEYKFESTCIQTSLIYNIFIFFTLYNLLPTEAVPCTLFYCGHSLSPFLFQFCNQCASGLLSNSQCWDNTNLSIAAILHRTHLNNQLTLVITVKDLVNVNLKLASVSAYRLEL